MSSFSCPVVRVSEVIEHPNADRLSIVKLEGLGFTCISGKLEDGSPRYKAGDFVVYIPSAALLPEWLLKAMDFWDDINNKGTLAGSDGNRVKPLKLRGIFSEGVLFPVEWDNNLANLGSGSVVSTPSETPGINSLWQVELGQDVAELLGITKYSPPIPVGMSGEVANMFGHTVKFDFDRWEQNTELFDPGEPVVATEKLHGCADYNTIVETLEFGPIKIGDLITQKPAVCYVKSYDIASNELVYERVEGYSVQPNNDDWYEIEVEDGRVIKLTGNHPVWLPKLNCYRQVSDLIGDEIVLID